ncbi:DUF397 domain-containing protein [Streptomyces roseirectus]|uniref:DUF397 domain-containing protein n=1 Tax=Streptomyces roseirectus TaxID=2768066 RepID=A0A7H0IIS3_9ACTN|nr:DUF397 domain-containing protein [Streptomyces roseirectus]QNP72689.1 DUF397 domain-containing protein [Streptomyces roseirectus]
MPGYQFVKSSYSNINNDCVEVARNIPSTIAVRDSKTPDGPLLTLAPSAWAAFTASHRTP